jgi:hypothetical protein
LRRLAHQHPSAASPVKADITSAATSPGAAVPTSPAKRHHQAVAHVNSTK